MCCGARAWRRVVLVAGFLLMGWAAQAQDQPKQAQDQPSDERYPSDLTDAEWSHLEPLIPPAKSGGRPRGTDMREAMNAILYILRTGCPWRYLPRGGFPPRSTVYNIFRNFKRDGVWDAIWDSLHMDLRENLGREASPTAAVIDSQTMKSAEKGAVTMAA